MRNGGVSWIGVGLLLLVLPDARALAQSPFWERTGGPEGGNILSLVAGPSGDLYARSYWGLVYRSLDSGSSWTSIPDLGAGCSRACAECDCGAGSIAVAPGGAVYAASGSRIFRSDDHGESWAATGFSGNAYAIAISPAGTVFVSDSSDQVRVSTDGGQTWDLRNAGLEGKQVSRFAFGSSGLILAGTSAGVYTYALTGGGGNWQLYGLEDQRIAGLGVDPVTGDVFAGTATTGCDKTYRRLASDGSWPELVSLSESVCYATDFAFASDGSILAATYQDTGVWRSTDGGATFQYAGLGMWGQMADGLRSVWALAIPPTTGDVFAGSSDGVFRSSDAGATWERVASGMKGVDASSILGTSSGSVFAGTTKSGLFRTDSKGTSWARPAQVVVWPEIIAIGLVGDASQFRSLLEDAYGRIFATFGYFAMSSDNGNTWTGVMPEWWCGFSNCQAWALAKGPTGDVYVSGNPALGIRRSRDGGLSWQTLRAASCDPVCQGPAFAALAVAQNGTIFAGTWPNCDPAFRGLYRSTDGGQTWDVAFQGEYYVKSIAIDSQGHIFVGTFQGLQRSRDNGATWEQVKTFGGENVVAVNRDDRIFVGHLGGGVFVSDDDGDTWTEISGGLTNRLIDSLGFDRDGYLYAGTLGSGVYRSVEPTFITRSVTIDIKPGSFPNTINLGSHGVTPVAILSRVDCDATRVDPLSVTLTGARVALKGKGNPMASFNDVNGDGLPDLLLHVETEAFELTETDTEAVLEGRTFLGTRIRGADTVRIVPER